MSVALPGRSRTIVVAAVLAAAAIGAGRQVWQHVVAERGVRWEPSDARYEALRRDLTGETQAGYLTDERLDRKPSDDGSELATELYQRAQYTLAPVLLRHDDLSPPLVVANLVEPARLEALLTRHHLVLVRRYDAGLALLRHAR